MNDWTAGYVADISYTYGCYPEMNPLRTTLAFLSSGWHPPSMGTHCELGFGQGVSINMHAAGSGQVWWGNDFNPSQVAFADQLAAASGAPLYLTDESFEQFCRREDLPDFDSIALHGIWSWISDENRHLVVDFLHRKLKVGGAVYISYNTQPGWAAMVPFRELLCLHAETMSAPGVERNRSVDDALGFADSLLKTQPAFLRANPQISDRLARLQTQDRSYLAHEYFNRDWAPMTFASMSDWLSSAKLSYVCSANFIEHVDALHLTSEQQQLVAGISDTRLRETVRDFCVNQQFRKDYWMRGPRRLTGHEQRRQLEALRVVLVHPMTEVPMTVSGALGEMALQAKAYQPVLALLSDYCPRTIGELHAGLHGELDFIPLLQVIMVLAGAGYVAPAQSEAASQAAQSYAQRLNAWILDQTCGGRELNYLCSPVTGGGLPVARVQQLFLDAHRKGKAQAEWVSHAWVILSEQGQKLLKAGKLLSSEEENLQELAALASKFAQQQLPILLALGV